MGKNSKIEWCDNTLNPWIGCQKVSPGCDHCYAEKKRCNGAHMASAYERRKKIGKSRSDGTRKLARLERKMRRAAFEPERAVSPAEPDHDAHRRHGAAALRADNMTLTAT